MTSNEIDLTMYIPIGQLSTLIGVGFAIYQFLNPITKLRLQSNKLFLPFDSDYWILKKITKKLNPFIGLMIISIILVLISNIIPSIVKYFNLSIPIVSYPVTWELFSFSIIICLTWKIFKIIDNPAKANKRNFHQFLKTTKNIIGSNEEKYISDLGTELAYSLSKIAYLCEDYIQSISLDQNKDNSLKKFNTNEHIGDLQSKLNINKECCFKILQLISDKSFCKTMACKNPHFLEAFFKTFAKCNLVNELKVIFDNILESCFKNQNSVLNREAQNHGLGFHKILTPLLFENQNLLKKENINHPLVWMKI